MQNSPFSPYVGLLVVYLRATGSFSLKDRRRIVRSLLDRARDRWNVSAVDMGPDNEKTDIVLAFSAVGTDRLTVDERLSAVHSFLCREEEFGTFELASSRREDFLAGEGASDGGFV